jgi:hypothetical protein
MFAEKYILLNVLAINTRKAVFFSTELESSTKYSFKSLKSGNYQQMQISQDTCASNSCFYLIAKLLIDYITWN